jgi:hypothetical protein
MADIIAAGKDIDCNCTRCKMVLAHTIVAVVAGVPVRVVCKTCRSEHKYRALKEDKPAPSASPSRSTSSSSSSSSAPRKPAATGSRGAPVITAFQLEQAWLDLIGSARRRSVPERPFKLTDTFNVGEVLRHVKFGDGVVKAAEPGRMTVVFRDGEKTLGHGRAAAE